MKVATYCPIFPGFYETIFSVREYEEAEEVSYLLSEAGADLSTAACYGLAHNTSVCEWDYKTRDVDYAGDIVAAVSRTATLEHFGIILEYEAIASPRYYNYVNDSLNVQAHIADFRCCKARMLRRVRAEWDAFSSYISRMFKSRPGFIPGHSDDAYVWLAELKAWQDGEEYDATRFGVLLDFFLLQDKFDAEALYYSTDTPTLRMEDGSALVKLIADPPKAWREACKQMEAYADLMSHRPDAVRKQQEGHEAALVKMIARDCKRKKR